MDANRISVRYAKAVYEFALEKGEESRLYEEMKVLEGHFKTFQSMKGALDDPTISIEEKEKVLITAAGISVSESYKRLLALILEHKRENYIYPIALMYQVYYRKQKGIVITKLTTSDAVSSEIKEKISNIVADETKEKVDMISITDPSIIGGFVLELEDKRLDASVKNQLIKMKQQLIEMNKHS